MMRKGSTVFEVLESSNSSKDNNLNETESAKDLANLMTNISVVENNISNNDGTGDVVAAPSVTVNSGEPKSRRQSISLRTGTCFIKVFYIFVHVCVCV